MSGDGEIVQQVSVVRLVTVASPTGADTSVYRSEYDPNENQDDSSYDSRYLLLDLTIGRDAKRGDRETYVIG